MFISLSIVNLIVGVYIKVLGDIYKIGGGEDYGIRFFLNNGNVALVTRELAISVTALLFSGYNIVVIIRGFF